MLEKGGTWITRLLRSRRPSPATRLVALFAAHGVHRNQIPRLIPPLTLRDVQDNKTLSSSLNEETLDSAAELFAVRREWLELASDQIYPTHDFYKRPEEFNKFLEGLLTSAKGPIRGVLLTAQRETHEYDSLIILEEFVCDLGDMPIFRYHFCNGWMQAYWKSRAYLTACVAFAWKRQAYIHGRIVPIETIRKYHDGNSLLEHEFDSALPTEGEHWHPEDMAVKPDCFVDGLKVAEFGSLSGLELWLTLDSKGLMDTGLPYTNVRSGFETCLNEHRMMLSQQA